MAPTRIPLEARFWPKVLKTDGCWLWQAQRTKFGYGSIVVYREDKKRHWPTFAHRVSWTLTRGPIPPGLNVLHRCDIPACVNPEHLFLGTQADNLTDCFEKGRHPVVAKTRAKLTPNDVRAIRLDTRWPHVIAAEYGVTRLTIKDVKSRKTWADVE